MRAGKGEMGISGLALGGQAQSDTQGQSLEGRPRVSPGPLPGPAPLRAGPGEVPGPALIRAGPGEAVKQVQGDPAIVGPPRACFLGPNGAAKDEGSREMGQKYIANHFAKYFAK